MRQTAVAAVLFIALLLTALGPAQLMGQTDSTRTTLPAAPFKASSGLPSDTPQVNGVRVAIVSGTLVAAITAIHIYQTNGWWEDNRRSFHFQEDLKYGLNVDKLGHMYGGTVIAFVFKKSFGWAGMSEPASLWWGSGASLLFQTYVEMEDGFSTWGFDRVDWASDFAGAAYPLAQHYWPPLRNFNFKFSYHPSSLINEPGGVGFKGQKHIMFDDYEGQTIWLSIDVNNLLPEGWRPYWPGWLCIAAGYGARDIVSTNPYRVYFVALDLDMTRLIPQDTAFLRTLSEALNFIHLPLPAVRVSPGAVWYGLYF